MAGEDAGSSENILRMILIHYGAEDLLILSIWLLACIFVWIESLQMRDEKLVEELQSKSYPRVQ
jgi:hypothetical protein